MTVPATPRLAGPFFGNGASTSFSFTFKVFATTDVQVSTVSASGVNTVLVLDSDYSVALYSDQDVNPGGTVTYPLSGSPLPSGATLSIDGNLPYDQTTALPTGGDYRAKAIERALDRATMQILQLSAALGQTLRVPEPAGVSEIADASGRANRLLGFDSAGVPTLNAPVSGSAVDLALLLAAPGGAAMIGSSPSGGVSATNVQAAIQELDAEWRASASGAAGDVSALGTRVSTLEATPLGSGIVAKATQALLYADLAYAAGTLGFVTEDSTTSKNGWYRKVGGSGSGSWAQSTTSADTVTNAAGQLALRIHQAVPVYGDNMIALKVADDRWLIRIPVVDGSPHDYTEYEMFNWGPYMGITHCWALHSVRARIGGVGVSFMEQHPSAGNVSTNEFAFKIGKLADYMADARRWNNSSYFDYYGPGHGHMTYIGLGIYLDGGATNYRDIAPVGTELRGSTFQFSSSYGPKTPDNTVVGTHGVDHVFSATGLQVSHQAVVSTAGIVCQDSYAGMAAFTGVNRIKAIGSAETVVGAQTGAQVGNWGAKATFAAFYDDRNTHLCELILPYGGPIGPGGDWSQATTSRTFVLDNANRIRKLYVNWRSGAVSSASIGDTGTPPPTYFGTYNFVTQYRVRKGAAV